MPSPTTKWDTRFLELAAHIAQWSKDPSTKCGAVIVRPDRTIASMGYNGFPQLIGDHPNLLAAREEKYDRIIHAEMNALLFLREQAAGYSLYTWPLPPCNRCMVHVIQSGISRVVAPALSDALAERWRSSVDLTEDLARQASITFITL